MLAPYIAQDAIRTLINGEHPGTSWVAIGLSIGSIVMMPLLGRATHRTATWVSGDRRRRRPERGGHSREETLTMSARVPSPNESQGSAAGRLLTQLARLLPEALDDEALHELASRLIPHLEERQSAGSREDRLLTAAEAAERAAVNVETVRRAIRAGDLRVAARIGRSARVSVVAIDDWLAKTVRTEDGTRPCRRRRSTRSGQPHELSLLAAFMTDD